MAGLPLAMFCPDYLSHKILFSQCKKEWVYPLNNSGANTDEVIRSNHPVSVLANQVSLKCAGKSISQLRLTVLKGQLAASPCCSARAALAAFEAAIEETRHICSATFLWAQSNMFILASGTELQICDCVFTARTALLFYVQSWKSCSEKAQKLREQYVCNTLLQQRPLLMLVI